MCKHVYKHVSHIFTFSASISGLFVFVWNEMHSERRMSACHLTPRQPWREEDHVWHKNCDNLLTDLSSSELQIYIYTND